MGRWSQYRKRGSVGAVVGTGIPAPTNEQWHLDAVGEGDVQATVDSHPDEAAYFFAQYTVGDIGAPSLPWVNDGDEAVDNPLIVTTTGPARVWVRIRWLDADHGVISDFSTPKFVDVA